MPQTELALLLWKEETQACIITIRENRTPAAVSAGSAHIAVKIGNETAMVSEIGPAVARAHR